LLFLPIFLIYHQTLSFEYTFDDHFLVVNKVDNQINNTKDLFGLLDDRYNNTDYRPVTMFSYGLEALFCKKMHPQASHLINIILFNINCILLFFLFIKIFGTSNRIFSFVIIALFACHPLCVEVVASVKSRDGLLSMLLGLLSLQLLIKEWNRQNIVYILCGILLLKLATLAKLDALGVIPFLVLYKLFTNGINKQQLINTAKIILGIVFLFIVINSILNNIVEEPDMDRAIGITQYTENSIVGRFTFLNRIGYLFETNAIYISKILFPINLRYYYGYAYYDLNGLWNIYTLLKVIFTLAFLYFAFKLRHNRDIALSLIGYTTFVAFALNFVTEVAGVVADRYVFMALPWALALLFYLVLEFLKKLNFEKWIYLPFSLAIMLLGFTSHNRAEAWKNDLSLIKRDAPHLTQSYEGMRIAANVYKSESNSSKSPAIKRKYLLKALECAQNANRVYPNNTLMHTYEGTYHFSLGDYKKSITSFNKALEVDSLNKTTHTFLGDVYYALDKLPDALKHYKIALQDDTKDYILINNIGTVLYEMGDKAGSLNFSRGILEKDASNLAALENLGYYYLAESDTLKAKFQFKIAYDLGLPKEMIPIGIE
jgi:protein O-mannosyl-transferase